MGAMKKINGEEPDWGVWGGSGQNRVVGEGLSKEGICESSVVRRSVTASLGEEALHNAVRILILIIPLL